MWGSAEPVHDLEMLRRPHPHCARTQRGLCAVDINFVAAVFNTKADDTVIETE